MDPILFFNGVIRGIDRAIIAVAAIALVAMMLHISIDASSSLLLNAPIEMTSAIVTEYYMVAVAFLPLAAGEYRGAHISVDLFVNKLAPVLRRWFDVMVLALCMAVYLVLAIQAWQQAMEKFATKAFLLEQSTQMSVWPSYFILPVGFGLIALLIGLKLLCRLLGRPEPAAPIVTSDDAEEALLERHGNV